MNIKKLSILLLLSLLLTSCTNNFDSQLEKGDNLFLEGKFNEAEVLFLELIEKHSEKSEPYLRLANIYLNIDDLDKTFDILNKGLENTENKNELNLKLGEIYLSLSDLENAKEFLYKVDEQSNDLAINLVNLAADSKDLEALHSIFNEYKDTDMVKESNNFFENSILAFSKLEDSEGIKDTINKVESLNLKLDPIVIVNAHNALIDLEMEDLANSIISKDIYNKDIADLSIIPSLKTDETNRKFINLTSGYFADPNRLDIAVLYGLDSEGFYYPNLEIVLINGKNGEIIDSLTEESIYEYMNLNNFDKTGNNEHILALWGHPGGSGTPPQIVLYEFNGSNIRKIDFQKDSDKDIVFKDNFEYEISSEKLGINYLLQLDLNQISYYLSEDLYDSDGKVIDINGELGFGYEAMDIISNLGSSDSILYYLPLFDTYDNKSYLGTVNSVFKFEDNKLIFSDLYVVDHEDNPVAYNYKEVEGYEEVNFKDLIPNKGELRNVLGFHLGLFGETENSLRTKFGEPLDRGYYHVAYVSYDNFIAHVDVADPDIPLYSIWTHDLLNIENSPEGIIRRFGNPDNSSFDSIYDDYLMDYYLDGFLIRFSNPGQENARIEISKEQ